MTIAMKDLDYEALGFMCGIEIHQQLDTRKLFCRCPSMIRDDEPHRTTKRRMRAVEGEMGNIDPAALHEFLRGRTLAYEGYDDTTCLVELDEEPPHPLNEKALKTSIEAALLFRAVPVSEIHVMRKTVIDGSNTSGFQRTILVAQDGKVDTCRGNVSIQTICLEEDAARIIGEENGLIRYRLDRLGIPLIEIATDPMIKDGEHAREVAQKLGTILRACKVKRGLGTIRQDINISIREGARVEVKGVQDLRLIKKIVEGEVKRQIMLIRTRECLMERGVSDEDYDIGPSDITHLFNDTRSNLICDAIKRGGSVMAVPLCGLEGLLSGGLGPQLSQYAKAMAGVGGIFHADELPGYGISPKEEESVRKELKIGGKCSYAIVADDAKKCEKALNAVLSRCKKALSGVPVETRRALDDGNTEFMRPLPGSSRMYPETDLPLLEISQGYIDDIRGGLPELFEDRAKRYERMGLGRELAAQLSKSGVERLFESLCSDFVGIDPTTCATLLTSTTKEAAKRHGAKTEVLNDSHYRQILNLLDTKEISKNIVCELLARVCESPHKKVKENAKANNLNLMPDDMVRALVDRIIRENPDLDRRRLIGRAMSESGGRADPKRVSQLVSKAL